MILAENDGFFATTNSTSEAAQSGRTPKYPSESWMERIIELYIGKDL